MTRKAKNPGDDIELLNAYSRAVTGVVAKVGPTVAHIHETENLPDIVPALDEVEGSGSGFVITPDGYVVTNCHVVEDSDLVEVSLADGTTCNAEIIGQDAATDIALLRINGSALPMVDLGDSEKIKVGQLVIAIGNPMGFQNTVTAGVISALGHSLRSKTGRLIENVIRPMPPLTRATAAGLY